MEVFKFHLHPPIFEPQSASPPAAPTWHPAPVFSVRPSTNHCEGVLRDHIAVLQGVSKLAVSITKELFAPDAFALIESLELSSRNRPSNSVCLDVEMAIVRTVFSVCPV